MQRKLFSQIFSVGLLGIVLSALFSCMLYYHAFSVQVRDDVYRLTHAYASMYEQSGREFPVLPDTAEDYRLTLIGSDGTVLADSKTQGILQNHADRPEVQQALETGIGYDERMSSTRSVQTFYQAIRLSDNRILRVSVDTASIYTVFLTVLPWLAFLLGLLLLLVFLLSKKLTHSLISPITEMGKHLDHVEDYIFYPELQSLAEALAEDRDLKREREQFRREFTANVSHELKTPLTGISGYAELIESNLVNQADIPTFAGHIHQEANRMLALIQDIIKLSELESQPADLTLSPELTQVDLSEIASDTVELLRFQARKAYLSLTEECESVLVQGNAALLKELCENLIENAIRYNRPGGYVTVSSGTERHRAFLCVADSGIGIPKNAQNRVFERFYRVDKSRSKATGGTGLGLSIVKHIALLHQAELQLESEVGIGTTITVWFPLSPNAS